MIPVSTLFDQYIDRPKLTEQKNSFEYIVPPPPTEVSRNKNFEQRNLNQNLKNEARLDIKVYVLSENKYLKTLFNGRIVNSHLKN